jgi:DNA-binding SARP family transcriptional activator
MRTEALVLASLGDVSFDRSDLREAQGLYEASLARARESRDSFFEVYALISLTNLYRIDQAWEQAHSLLNEADSLSKSEKSGYTRGLVELCRGMLFSEENRSDDAISSLKSAMKLLRDAGGRRELAKATLWYAHALFRAGTKEEAFGHLQAAIDMCRDLAHSHLLVVDGSRMLGLLEEAKSIDGADDEMFNDLLLRISQFTLETIHRPGVVVDRKVTPPRLEIRAFGEGTVSVNGEPIPHTAWGGPLVKELFFFLLENQRARREVILDIFWPKYSTAKAKSVFHATLYRMRRVLPKGTVGYDSSNEVYFFDLQRDFWYDVAVFTNLMDEVRRGNGNLENLTRQVLGIYKGDYLIGIYSNWCLQKREALRRLYVDGLEQQANMFANRGELEEAMDLYHQVVINEPFREDVHRELMRSLVQTGRQAEAVHHYRKFAQFLHDEMHVKPTLETTRLYKSILE